jgi:tripeptide aminopeptidase
MQLDFDRSAAVDRLLRFLAVEGVTGHEADVAHNVEAALVEVGVPRKAIRFDSANKRIPLPTQTGNLIVNLPGTRSGPRLLFSTHLDTVPLCAGARPIRKGRRIVSAGPTALGGDNRTGVAVLVTLATTLLGERLPHPPLTLLFTVREESGLFGARFVDRALLNGPAMGFNVDGGSASSICTGAVGADRWEVEILGCASHAGVHPERGVSASLVASLAIAEIHRTGWFGKVVRDGRQGASNVGVWEGRDGKSVGDATNVVTDYVRLRGESRSHDFHFVRAITAAYKQAFRDAANQVVNDRGKKAKVRFQSRTDYHPFRLAETSSVVRYADRAARLAGLHPEFCVANGGLDANWLVRHGIPTVTFGAGQNNIHSLGEYVDLDEFENGCRLALALAQLEP